MKYYVRKINLSKFPKPPNETTYSIASLRADAVADIRTYNDGLSIWEIESNTEDAINEAVLALVTSSKQKRFDRIDIVVFTEKDLISNDLQIEKESGDTAVVKLRDSHYNIVGLTYKTISKVLKIISDITIKNEQKRLTRNDIQNIVRNNLDKISFDVFTEDSMKDEIQLLRECSSNKTNLE